MRNFKIFLWIFVVFLIQTVILSHVHVLGAVPSVVMAYVMCVMLMENEFRNAVIISVICAVSFGALCGREFVTITLFYVYSSIIVFSLRKKPAYVGNFAKAVFWTIIASAILELLYFVHISWTLNLNAVISDALPTAVFNTVLTIIVYPILKRTMYKEEKKKLLII